MMYEDLWLAEALYFLLLVTSYVFMASGYRRLGLMLALFSLLPPAFATAKYYTFFVAEVYEFLRQNTWAYALLAVATFAMLLTTFIKLGLCDEEMGAMCIYIAFGAAAVGSALLLLLAASGGLALAYCALHWVMTAMIYTLALRAEKGRG
jgi:uncharacterized membrane protein YidH (DUF202 family)